MHEWKYGSHYMVISEFISLNRMNRIEKWLSSQFVALSLCECICGVGCHTTCLLDSLLWSWLGLTISVDDNDTLSVPSLPKWSLTFDIIMPWTIAVFVSAFPY